MKTEPNQALEPAKVAAHLERWAKTMNALHYYLLACFLALSPVKSLADIFGKPDEKSKSWAYTRSELEACITLPPEQALPKLITSAGFIGTDPDEINAGFDRTATALSILRKRGDYSLWIYKKLSEYAKPGFELKDTKYGGPLKLLCYEGLDAEKAHRSISLLFTVLERIATFESIQVALTFIDDGRVLYEPSDDVPAYSIGQMAISCIEGSAYRMGFKQVPGTSTELKQWFIENAEKLKTPNQSQTISRTVLVAAGPLCGPALEMPDF